MAGRGPAAKLRNQRGRPSGLGEWVRLEPLAAPILPPLRDFGGAPTGNGQWPKITQMLWNAWRESPVTATWSAEDIALAADTIRLHAAEPILRAGEIRIRIDNLGLSPKGRRDARLLLPDEQSAEAGPPLPEPTQRELPDAV